MECHLWHSKPLGVHNFNTIHKCVKYTQYASPWSLCLLFDQPNNKCFNVCLCVLEKEGKNMLLNSSQAFHIMLRLLHPSIIGLLYCILLAKIDPSSTFELYSWWQMCWETCHYGWLFLDPLDQFLGRLVSMWQASNLHVFLTLEISYSHSTCKYCSPKNALL